MEFVDTKSAIINVAPTQHHHLSKSTHPPFPKIFKSKFFISPIHNFSWGFERFIHLLSVFVIFQNIFCRISNKQKFRWVAFRFVFRFSILGTSFCKFANATEIVRINIEIIDRFYSNRLNSTRSEANILFFWNLIFNLQCCLFADGHRKSRQMVG